MFVYDVYNPGGNITALVKTKFPAEARAEIARKLLAANQGIEQVGFITDPVLPNSVFRLEMMGGEFCVNAARSAAYDWNLQTGVAEMRFEVSGFLDCVEGRIANGRSEIIIPKSFIQSVDSVAHGWRVDFSGISFLVVTEPLNEVRAKQLINHYKAAHVSAFGIITTKDVNGILAIDPWVWVRETDTLIHETACGSGTFAAYLTGKNKYEQQFLQPSGSLFAVTVMENGNLRIGGIIDIFQEQYYQTDADTVALVSGGGK